MNDIDQLYIYFKNALKYLDNEGNLFSKKYGGNLNLSEPKDPDVKRLIEAFAMFDARLNFLSDQQQDRQARMILSMITPELLTEPPCGAIIQLQIPNANQNVLVNKSTIIYTEFNSDTFRFSTCDQIELINIVIDSINIVSLSKNTEVDENTGLEIKLSIVKATNLIRVYINAEENFANVLIKSILCGDNNLYTTNNNLESLIKIGRICPYIPKLTESNLCGYSLQTLYDYSIFPEAFNFIDLIFDIKINPINNFTILLLLSNDIQLNTTLIDKNIFLLNCLPVINLFEQKSEPIRISYKDEQAVILASIGNKLKINKVLKVHYQAEILSIQKDYFIDYHYNNITYLFLKNKFTYIDNSIMYASLLCRNSDEVFNLQRGTRCIVDKMNFISSQIVKITQKPTRTKNDYWLLLKLYSSIGTIKQNNILEYINLSNQIFNLKSCIESINVIESVAIGNNAWKTVVNKLIYELNILFDSKISFILALIWSKIIVDQGNFTSIVEVKIISNNNTLYIL